VDGRALVGAADADGRLCIYTVEVKDGRLSRKALYCHE
jgi:hypothetical protein